MLERFSKPKPEQKPAELNPVSKMRVHAPGKSYEATVHRGANGEAKAVFVRELLWGLL